MDSSPIIRITDHGTELFCYKGKIIETDRKDNMTYNSVLSIYPGGGVHYLIDHLTIRAGDYALDLCTGSGVLGIYAAEKASKVIATDISSRALEFARRNAKRNHVSNIEFREGNLFKPVAAEKFDYIVSNPPFIPVPDKLRAPLHSCGGSDGLYYIREILRKTGDFLKPNGRMQLFSLSLGTKDKSFLEDILKDTLNNRNITMMSFYSEPLPLSDFVASLNHNAADEWGKRLENFGVTHMYSYLVNIEPGEIPKTAISPDERKTFPDDWKDWRRKFKFLIFE